MSGRCTPARDLIQGGLAGAVLARQGVGLARVQPQRDVTQGWDGAEGFTHSLQGEHRSGLRFGMSQRSSLQYVCRVETPQ